MREETSRAAFEAWCKSEGISTESDENGYMWSETVIAWESWQASRKVAMEEDAKWYKSEGWLLDEDDVPEAIRALK